MANHKHKDGKLESLRQQGTLNLKHQAVIDELFVNDDFFDPRDLFQVKYEMLRRVRVDGLSISQAAKLFGVSRPSFYQAQAGFKQAGLIGLLPKKRGPHKAHKITKEIINFIKQAKTETQYLRTPELIKLIKEQFGLKLHRRTIERAMADKKKKVIRLIK